MEIPTTINSIGLCIDAIGATIVFFNTPEKTYATYLYQKAELEQLKLKAKKIRRNARAGFILLGIGFILQLISNFIK